MQAEEPEEEDLEAALGDLVRSGEEVDAEPVAGEATSRTSHTRTFMYREERGPLPSQQWLEAAERHTPGVTRILVDDLVEHRRHARAMELRAVDFDERSFSMFDGYQRTQLWMAFFLSILVAGGGIALALDGQSLYGFAVLIGEIAALVLAFLWGRSRGGANSSSDDESQPPS